MRLAVTICCLILLSASGIGTCFAQTTVTVSGTVSDDKGKLPGATVFLANTRFMTGTGTDGQFKFNKVPPGSYSLIVKMLGFEPFLKQIMVGEGDFSIDVLLKENITQLSAVVIKPDKEWFKNLKVFKAQFLGESENAKQCTILNAEVLTLKIDSLNHKLIAKSDKLLKIENKALGYRLTYLLVNFEYDMKKHVLVYKGYPSFEMMRGSEEEEAEWKEKRAIAYQGSIQHFITSVYDNDTRKQGFLVFELNRWTPGGNGYHNTSDSLYRKKRISTDTLLTPVNGNYKTLAFNRALFVLYQKHGEERQYQANGYSLSQLFDDKRLPDGQSSIINLLTASVTIDGKGGIYKPNDLFLEGYMGWQKISNLTPFGFEGK